MKETNGLFLTRFEKHLVKFIQDYSLFNQTQKLYLAVSGGVDSMVLMDSILSLRSCGYSNELEVLHVNHATRPGQDDDQKLVASYCLERGIRFSVKKLENLQGSNFEQRARDARYEFFRQKAQGEKILFAHHIDDSLEWSLMQQFKSSNVKGSIGIPVINKNVIRPMMAFSKKQILRYASIAKIPFNEDPTNTSNAHERNRMRKNLVAFKHDYPAMIKNYVSRHNELAHKLGLHAKKGQSSYKVFYAKGIASIFNFKNEMNENELKVILRKIVHNFSGKKRSSLRDQLDKAILMIKNNKSGPLIMAGGVEILNCYSHLLIKKPDTQLHVPILDNPVFNTMTYEEFKIKFHHALTQRNLIPSYPLWVVMEPNPWVVAPKKAYLHSESLFVSCKEMDFELISSGNLLKQWSKKDSKRKSLSLHFVW